MIRRFFIPPWLDDLNLKPHAFRVLCHLLRRAGDDGRCNPSAEGIAKACQMDVDTVWKCIAKLEADSLLSRKKERFQGCNTYVLNLPFDGKWGVIDDSPTHGKTGVIDPLQSPEKPGCQLTDKPGCQLPAKPGQEETLLKETPSKKPKKREPEVTETLPFDSPEFAVAWREWQQHRKELGKSIKPTSATKQLKQLADMGESRAVAAINHSITRGWTGIFEAKALPASTPGTPTLNLGRRAAPPSHHQA